jgi:[ribosomal protein S5]-alanine N-acetyltransferase
MGARVSLWPVTAGDRHEFVAHARESVSMHRGLVFVPTTTAEFDEYLVRFDGAGAIGFVVRLNTTKELAGFVNINHIVWSPDRTGALGYGGFAATAGHGYVAEAVRLVVRYAFAELGLDRLEADIQPGNAPSRKVVEQAGFRQTQAARHAIRIGGEWRDHERWRVIAKMGSLTTFKYLESCTSHAKR